MFSPAGIREPRAARLIGTTVVAARHGRYPDPPGPAGTRRTVGQLYGVFPLPVAGPES
jgi:hypothetical protein